MLRLEVFRNFVYILKSRTRNCMCKHALKSTFFASYNNFLRVLAVLLCEAKKLDTKNMYIYERKFVQDKLECFGMEIVHILFILTYITAIMYCSTYNAHSLIQTINR